MNKIRSIFKSGKYITSAIFTTKMTEMINLLEKNKSQKIGDK